MYLLDSCTISDFMKGEKNTSIKLKALSPSLIYISSITQMEILYGLLRKFDKSHKYFTFFEEFISAINLLAFDKKAAESSAQIRYALEQQDTPIGSYDILIAGIAVSENLTLVTSNEKEFSRIKDLQIENWRQQGRNKY